jgi:HSP20 family protein
MMKHKRSFFEKLTGNFTSDEEDELEEEREDEKEVEEKTWLNDEEEGELNIDMFQTPHEVIIQAMVAGVKPEDLDVSINKDMLTLKGRRQKTKEVTKDNYYFKELYWGSFSRSIMLPQEIDAEHIEARLKNGLLTLKLPKLDKGKPQKVKIESE